MITKKVKNEEKVRKLQKKYNLPTSGDEGAYPAIAYIDDHIINLVAEGKPAPPEGMINFEISEDIKNMMKLVGTFMVGQAEAMAPEGHQQEFEDLREYITDPALNKLVPTRSLPFISLYVDKVVKPLMFESSCMVIGEDAWDFFVGKAGGQKVFYYGAYSLNIKQVRQVYETKGGLSVCYTPNGFYLAEEQ